MLSWRTSGTTRYRDATATLKSAIRSVSRAASVGVCGGEAVGEIGFGERVGFVWRAGREFDAGDDSIVIVDVGGDQTSECVDGLEVMEEEPLVLELLPECLDH